MTREENQYLLTLTTLLKVLNDNQGLQKFLDRDCT